MPSATARRPAEPRSHYHHAPYIAQRIHAEKVVLLGWNAAILVQFAHPLVAAGLTDHSTFLTHPERRPQRLSQTLDAMLALTFGDEAAVLGAARRINTIHDGVHGVLPESVGIFPVRTPYSAHDPELLRWVHATMLDVMPRAYELYVGPLSAAERDTYCADASEIAPLLGIPDNYLPDSTRSLERYFYAMFASGAIAVGRQARILAHEILNPILPVALQPLRPLLELPAIGLLPPYVRQAYGLQWPEGDERRLRAVAFLTRALVRITPAVLRQWPLARRAAGPPAGRCPLAS